MGPELTEQRIPDDILVHRTLEGDKAAFDALVLRYQSQAVVIAQSVIGNFDLAKDAAQNAFVKAYYGLKQFRRQASFKTWLIRIVLNEAKSARRKERVRRFVVISKEHDEEDSCASLMDFVPSADPLPFETLEREELKRLVVGVVHQLPPRERDVLVLHYFEHFTLNEVAGILNIALGTVKAHLAHGLVKFETVFKKESARHE